LRKNYAQEGGNDKDSEADQGSTQLLEGPITRATAKKVESSQQVLTTILEVAPTEKDAEAKIIPTALIITGQ